MNPHIDSSALLQLLRHIDFHQLAGCDALIEDTPHIRLAQPVSPDMVAQRLKQSKAHPQDIKSPISTNTDILPHQKALALANEQAATATSWEALQTIIQDFKAIDLASTANHALLGKKRDEATKDKHLLWLTDTPKLQEELKGQAFCDEEAQLLQNIIAAMGADFSQQTCLYSVFWRPPGNRTPTQNEIALCRPFLMQAIELVRPDMIIALGDVAFSILNLSPSTSTQAITYGSKAGDIEVLPLLSLSKLLKNPALKAKIWPSLCQIKMEFI